VSERPAPQQPAGRFTYVLVDGENIDATLGSSVFGRRPQPEERPRWERVTKFAAEAWQQPVRGLFFLAATSRDLPVPFIQALLAMDYRPIPLTGSAGEKVVDIAIQRTLAALTAHAGDVMLASHDGDFLPQITELLGGRRRVGLIGFREFINSGFAPLVEHGLDIFDLERDVSAFNTALPRIRAIPIEEFDPLDYL
jgi:uncharacterized protein